MNETNVLTSTDEFKVLVVDDDPDICTHIRNSLKDVSRISVKGIEYPEEIESPEILDQEYSLVILDVIFQNEKNYFDYLFQQAKQRWPYAIIIVVSNYIYEGVPLIVEG